MPMTSPSSSCHAISMDIPEPRHPSLSSIVSGSSPGLDPVSTQSCCV